MRTVFVSSTSNDLASYRKVVKDALLSMGLSPVLQEYFPADPQSGETVLAETIKRCDAVVCLVGFAFGAEPSQRPLDRPRRSFAQIEYDIARRLEIPLFVFLAEESCPFDSEIPKDEDVPQIQQAFRSTVLKAHIVGFFSDADRLRSGIFGALTQFAAKEQRANSTQNCREHTNVFISAKSADYEYAREVFRFLSSRGIAAFLSDVSLPELGSSDYRREIDRALDEAHHMVVVTSSREHVESPCNGVDLSTLWCSLRFFLVFLSTSVAGSWLFQFRVLGLSSLDCTRFVAAGAIPHKVGCGRVDYPREIIGRFPFIMKLQPGIASRTKTDLSRMDFQHCSRITHQNSHKIVTQDGHRNFAIQVLGSQATKFTHPHARFIRPDIDLHVPPPTVQFRNVLSC